MSANQPAAENRLLAGLPRAEYERLLPRLEAVPLGLREVLHPGGAPLTHIYFPLKGAVSLVTVLADGREMESASIGSEGVVGVGLLLGNETPTARLLVQVP